MSKKERLNVKETIYISRTLSDEIDRISEQRNMGFNATVRYLLTKAIEYED